MKLRSVSFVLLALTPAAMAGAQTKVSGTLQCAKPNPQYSVEVGDAPGHMFTLSKAACTWTKPMDISGSQTKEGTSANREDVKGTRADTEGFHTSTMANGEKIFVKYEGEAELKDGAPQSVHGRWRFRGGTGNLKKIHGKGTYKGTPAADGSITFAIEGDYDISPDKPAPSK